MVSLFSPLALQRVMPIATTKRASFALAVILVASATAFAQSDEGGADVSGALAAIQAKQNSAQSSVQPRQAYPALKGQSCKEAVPYVESPSGLLGQWDADMGKYKAYQNGFEAIKVIKDKLLNDEYWNTSTPAVLANDIHTISKLTEDSLAVLMPGGQVVDNAIRISEDFGSKVSQKAVLVYQLIEKGDGVIDSLRSSTDELTVLGISEAAKQAGYGRVAAAVDALKVLDDHMKNEQDAAKSRDVVQQQVRQLNIQLNELANKIEQMRDNLVAVEALKDAVIAACNSDKPIKIAPEFTSGLAGTPPPSQDPSVSEASSPVLPWWALLSSIHPVVIARGQRSTQVQSRQTQQNSGGAQQRRYSTDVVGPGPKPVNPPGCPH
jgi:hypothetical protein